MDPYALAAAAVAVAGLLLVIAATSRYGPGLLPDSANYLSAAESLRWGQGLRDVGGEPFVYWPPLFPALLALGERLGLSGAASGRWLAILSFAATLYLAARWLWSEVRQPPLRLLGITAAALAPALQSPARFVLSEALFVLLVLAATIYLQRYLDHRGRKDALLWAAATCLACLQRYVGLALIAAAALALLATPPRRTREWVGAGGLAAATAFPLLLWLARNYHLTRTLTGWRGPSSVSLPQNTTLFGGVVAAWYLPPHARWGGGWSAGVLACVVLVMLSGVLRHGTWRQEFWKRSTAFLFVIGAYSLWILVSASLVAFDPINNRLLCPIYLPLLLCILLLLDTWPAEGRLRRWAQPFAWASALPLVLFPAGQTLEDVARSGRSGPGGYASSGWSRSSLVRYLREHSLADHPLYTNDPAALYLFLGLRSSLVPERTTPSILDSEEYERMEQVVGSARGVYLVWFRQGYAGLYGRDEVCSEFGVEEQTTQPDGTVVLLTR